MAGECEPEKRKGAGWHLSRSHHRLQDPVNDVQH